MSWASSVPDQCTNSQVSHGARVATVISSRPEKTSDNVAPAVSPLPPARPIALMPVTSTTTMTSLENTSAAAVSTHLRTQPRVASQLEPANASRVNAPVTSSSALRISSTAHSKNADTIAQQPKMTTNTGPPLGLVRLTANSFLASSAIPCPL